MHTPVDKKTILIVEDDLPTLKSVSGELENCGYAVLEAEDGERGLKLALKEKPDLILLDILLPKMDGREVMKKLRENEWGKTALVIFLTNLTADDSIIKEIIKTEPAYYLIKPNWTLADIMEKVKEVLRS